MKFNFSNTPIGKLRIVGLAEGTSFLLLLLVAMPLKYVAHIPQPVKIIGWIHGLLFVLYIVALLKVWLSLKWPFRRALIAFVASLIPFGTFLQDKKLHEQEQMLLNKKIN